MKLRTRGFVNHEQTYTDDVFRVCVWATVHPRLPREDAVNTKLEEKAEHRLSSIVQKVPVFALLVAFRNAREVKTDQGFCPASAADVSSPKHKAAC